MIPNRFLVFVKPARGVPVAGEHLVAVEGSFDPDADPPAGRITAQTMYASLDPSMRLRMAPPEDSKVFSAYSPGQVVTSTILIKLLQVPESVQNSKPGDILRGYLPIQEYHTLSVDDLTSFAQIDNAEGFDLPVFLGPLGSPGLAAYAVLNEIGKPLKGETILVSAASGAVGQTVGQLARHYWLTVIGIVVNCGAVSQYNVLFERQYGVRNLLVVVSKSLTLRGFSSTPGDWVFGYAAEHQEKVRPLVKNGTVKPLLNIKVGIEKGPAALVELFRGDKLGKSVLDFGVA